LIALALRGMRIASNRTFDEESTMKIKDVMTPDVSFVSPDTPVAEIARRMRDEDIGVVPVTENDRMIGMVTDRDIVVRCIASGNVEGATARTAMSPRVLYCYEDQSVNEILDNMAEQQIRRMPVVSRDKRLVGVVSIGDLSQKAQRKAGESLKEISQPAPH
jgi:CBS domain-containing protein